ncbi:hypothetical protein CL629_03385 [bacterium]|nr:hypothetical protein [bacterium]
MPQPTREYRFHPTRKWRFDFAWVEEKIAVEVEGGIWNSGRHSRGYGMEADMEKYNEATSLGWKVFRISGKHIASRKDILRWIAGALAT